MHAVEIDGKTLEGGGQLVRIILGLSALTRRPVHITNVRANRRNPRTGQGGGLKRQHLTAAKWLAQACDAHTEGLELSNSEVLFQPSGSVPDLQSQLHGRQVKLPDGRLAKGIFISLESQGATALLLQAILPYLLLSGCSSKTGEEPCPIHLTLEGGTHVTSAPSLCYITHVLIPNLRSMYGAERPLIEVSPLEKAKRGWNFGSRELGRASFVINPVSEGASLATFTLRPRGGLKRLQAIILAPDIGLSALRWKTLDAIKDEIWDVEDVVTTAEESGQRQRYYLLLVAETESGTRIGSDCLWSGAMPRGGVTPEKIAEQMSQIAVKKLKRELATGLPVDHHMMDQMAVFMGLAEGVSRLRSEDEKTQSLKNADCVPSMHAQTARWSVEKLLGATFEEDGTSHGVAFRAGTQTWTPAEDASELATSWRVVEDSIEDSFEESFDHLHL